MRNIFLAILLIINSLSAYESDLIKPKDGQANIIDIGYLNPSDIQRLHVKEWTYIDALLQNKELLKDVSARELSEEWDCLTDEMSHENCSEKLEVCPIDVYYNQGNSTRHDIDNEIQAAYVDNQLIITKEVDVLVSPELQSDGTFACPAGTTVNELITVTNEVCTDTVIPGVETCSPGAETTCVKTTTPNCTIIYTPASTTCVDVSSAFQNSWTWGSVSPGTASAPNLDLEAKIREAIVAAGGSSTLVKGTYSFTFLWTTKIYPTYKNTGVRNITITMDHTSIADSTITIAPGQYFRIGGGLGKFAANQTTGATTTTSSDATVPVIFKTTAINNVCTTIPESSTLSCGTPTVSNTCTTEPPTLPAATSTPTCTTATTTTTNTCKTVTVPGVTTCIDSLIAYSKNWLWNQYTTPLESDLSILIEKAGGSPTLVKGTHTYTYLWLTITIPTYKNTGIRDIFFKYNGTEIKVAPGEFVYFYTPFGTHQAVNKTTGAATAATTANLTLTMRTTELVTNCTTTPTTTKTVCLAIPNTSVETCVASDINCVTSPDTIETTCETVTEEMIKDCLGKETVTETITDGVFSCPSGYLEGNWIQITETSCAMENKIYKYDWWFCDTCYSNDMGLLITNITNIVKSMGGTGLVSRIEGSLFTKKTIYKHDAPNSIFFQLNSGTKLEVKGGEEFYIFYKGVKNVTTGQQISAIGGKLMLYVTSSGLVEVCVDTIKDVLESCIQDYTYYDYDCKNIALPAGYMYGDLFDWEGPLVTAGGDCNGDCGSLGCECNPATPPAENCSLVNFICPVDATKACTKRIDESTVSNIVENLIGDFIYANGDSEEFNKTITSSRKCEFGFVWNMTTGTCEQDAKIGCEKASYTLDETIGCYTNILCDENQEYDLTLKKCVQKPNIVCETGMIFDSSKNTCVATSICKEGILTANGDCKLNVDQLTDGGCLDNLNGITWVHSETDKRCYADIIEQPLICEGPDYDNSDPEKCVALFNSWYRIGSTNSNWTVVNPKVITQGKNGYPTAFIHDRIYMDSVMFKGDFKTVDTDDDFVGFVFGYTNTAGVEDFYLFYMNRSRLNSGAGHTTIFGGVTKTATSGGGLFKVTGTFATPWGFFDSERVKLLAVNTGTSAELSADPTRFKGWENNVNHSIKINYFPDGIEIFVDDVSVINYTYSGSNVYKNGKIGFFNNSIAGVTYSNFEMFDSGNCKSGYVFSDILKKCYLPIKSVYPIDDMDLKEIFTAKKYSSYDMRTYLDPDNSTTTIGSDKVCPINKDGTFWEYDEASKLCYSRTVAYDSSVSTCNAGYTYDTIFKKCVKSVHTIYPVNDRSYTNIYSQQKYSALPVCQGDTRTFTNGNCISSISCEVPEATFDANNFQCLLDATLSCDNSLMNIEPSTQFNSQYTGKVNIQSLGEYDININIAGIMNSFQTNFHRILLSDNNWYSIDAAGELTLLSTVPNRLLSSFDINIHDGLSLIAISDKESINNSATSDNYMSEHYIINNTNEYTRQGFGDMEPVYFNKPESVCSEEVSCPDGDFIGFLPSGEKVCISNDIYYYCESFFQLVGDKCTTDGYCNTGFVKDADICKLDYTYYKYTCPVDFEISDVGIDCVGSCGYDGCVCNGTNPPANNCKQATTLSTDNVTIEVRDIKEHLVEGEITPKEYGQFKNYACGPDCDFNIIKITGENENLCFEKASGTKECFTVEGCSFSGVLEDLYMANNLSSVPKLRDLNLKDQNTLVLADYNAAPLLQNEDTIECTSSGTTYNPNTRYCEGGAVFTNWTKQGDPDAGNWSVTSGGTKVYQSINGNPTYFVSDYFYTGNVVFSGSINVGNDGDDDYVGLVFGFENENSHYRVYASRDPNDPISHNVTRSGDELTLVKVTNGTVTTLATAPHAGWRATQTFIIKVAYIDNMIKVYINDQLFIEYQDTAVEKFQDGRIGFFNSSQSQVTYWDFFIESSPLCDAGFSWDEFSRTCSKEGGQEIIDVLEIKSTCKMNGHVGWHSREEGIVSIISDGDRMKFWDSYNDKDLGFIEFIKDADNQDRADGFMPENTLLYDLLGDKFTAIDKVGTTIYAVSSEVLTDEECQSYADKYSLSKYTSTTPLNKLHRLSGNRYRMLISPPSCLGGFYEPDVDTCISGLNSAIMCPNGKFNITMLPVIGNYGVTNATLINYPIEIMNSDTYIFNVDMTAGSSAILLVDGVNRGTLSKFESISVPLEKGLHKINFSINGVAGLIVKDSKGEKITSTADWCNNTTEPVCPDSGFVLYENICAQSVIPYCETGEMDPETRTCILKPKCVLAKHNDIDGVFADQDKLIKQTVAVGGSAEFVCSPLTCDNHTCQEASCPADYLGTDIELTADEIDAYALGDLCLDQTCDAKLEYYPVCGRDAACPDNEPGVVLTEDGECKEMYCDEGTLDIQKEKCRVLRCPLNTTENANGECVEN